MDTNKHELRSSYSRPFVVKRQQIGVPGCFWLGAVGSISAEYVVPKGERRVALGAAQSSQPRRVKLKRHLSSVVLVEDPLLSDKLSIRQKIVAPKTNFLIGDLKCKKL